MIYRYRKASDAYTIFLLLAPEGGTELCTIAGWTYVHIPDGDALPAQPVEIAASVAAVTIDPVLRDEISNASPHVALIRQRVADRIAARYSVGDEIKLLRTAPSAEFEAYNAYVEDCRAWGREQKAALGL